MVLVIVLAGGAAAYWKWSQRDPVARACTRMVDLCGKTAELASCDDFAKVANQRAATCVLSSQTCVEAMGCMMGSALDDLQRGFERSTR